MVHGQTLVVTDRGAVVVFDAGAHVLFGVDAQDLGALLVFELDFVVIGGIAARRGARLETTLGRGLVGNLLLVVVHAPDDNGAVRVAVEKIDNHFVANARREIAAPTLARPG